MNCKLQILILYILLFLAIPFRSQEYIENVVNYCGNVDFSNWEYTEEERNEKRAASKSIITIKFGDIYNFVQNGEPATLITATIIYMVIIGILLGICIASLVFYLLYCCYFKQYPTATIGKIKLFCILSSVCLVIFGFVLIALIVYIAKLNSKYRESNCAIAKIPNDILEGVRFSEKEFMGLRNLRQVLINMEGELDNLQAMFNDFTKITDVNPKDLGNQASMTLDNFIRQTESVKVSDGNGELNRPNTVTSFLEKDKDIITAEFDILKDVCEVFYDGADIGKIYNNEGPRADAKTSINGATTVLTAMINPIESNMGKLSSYMSDGAQYLAIGYYLTLVLSLVILFLSTVMIFIVYFQFAKEKCFGMQCPFKTCLAVAVVANIFIIIISIFVMLLTSGISSFCDFNTSLLTSESIETAISSSGVSFSEDEIKLYTTCISNEPSTLTDLIGSSSDDLDNISTLIDGFSRYRLFQSEFASDTTSKTISDIIKIWEKYQTGLFIDFDNVIETMNEFNELIRCQKIEFRMNSHNCTTINPQFTCRVISSNPTYQAPDCADDQSAADRYFRNLLDYIMAEERQMSDLIEDLSGPDDNTPNSEYSIAKESLIDLQPVYSKIENQMSRTLQLASQYGEGFKSGSDCSALKKTMENLEAALCFDMNQDVFFFFIFLLGAIICAIIMNWFICITFRCIPQVDTNKSSVTHDDTETSAIIENKKEV